MGVWLGFHTIASCLCKRSETFVINYWCSESMAELTPGLSPLLSTLNAHIYAAVIVSNVSHFLAVLVLYLMAKVLHTGHDNSKKLPVIVASLHILSPAGLFLCVPYAESLFSLLNFSGFLAYCGSRKYGAVDMSWQRDILLVLAGALFGVAATVRSNGSLNAGIFAYDILTSLSSFSRVARKFEILRYLAFLSLAGILVALGFALPQFIAYREYCMEDYASSPSPEWCKALPPSIYTYVQGHYWYALPVLALRLLDYLTRSSGMSGFSVIGLCRTSHYLCLQRRCLS